MLLRFYIPDDFPQLYAIEVVCFKPPFRFGRRYMRQLVDCLDAATWIAEEDGLLSGFAIVEGKRRPDEITAYIQTLEVLPERRCCGIGGQLLRRIEDSARAIGAATIWLHVDARNAGAVRLYEANGYLYQDRRENYYAPGRAALIYSKPLPQETAPSTSQP